jgi:hypothetical protein
MAKIATPGTTDREGIWLLSQNDLEELDSVIEKIERLIINSCEIQGKDYGQSPVQITSMQELQKIGRKVALVFEDDRRLTDSSIKNLLKENSLRDLKPKELTVSIRHGNNFFKLRISSSKDNLRYEIDCYDLSDKDEIRYEIEKWIDSKSNWRVLSFWSSISGLAVIILIIPLLIYTLDVFFTSYTTYKSVAEGEMRAILKTGIDSTNLFRAVELGLHIQSGFVPSNFVPKEQEKDPKDIKILVGLIFLFLVFIFKPKSVIGIGKNKAVLDSRRIWIKIVTVTIPAALIIAPLWNRISQWIYH